MYECLSVISFQFAVCRMWVHGFFYLWKSFSTAQLIYSWLVAGLDFCFSKYSTLTTLFMESMNFRMNLCSTKSWWKNRRRLWFIKIKSNMPNAFWSYRYLLCAAICIHCWYGIDKKKRRSPFIDRFLSEIFLKFCVAILRVCVMLQPPF